MSAGQADPAGLRPGQYRVMAVGFCFPVAFGGFGVGLSLHAIVLPTLDYLAYAMSLPAIALVWVMQHQLWRATRKTGGPAQRVLLARVRHLFIIPYAAVAAGLLLSGGLLLAGRPKAPPHVPLHALLVATFACGLIGACFLPLTARARAFLPSS